MTHQPTLTASILADLCQHVFPEREGQRGDAIEPMHSRQHEMVAFDRLLALLHTLEPPEDVRAVTPTVTLPIAIANLTALAMRMQHEGIAALCEKAMRLAFDVPETAPVLLHGDYHFSNALLHEGQI